MPDPNAKSDDGKFSKEEFKGLVRKNGQGWAPDKYGRMGIYVYLYNRIKGRPTRWGLENEDVSFRIKDVIQTRFDEVIAEYITDYTKKEGPIKGLDLTDPDQKAQFIREINEYNEHAQKVDSPMPSTQTMSKFLQTVADEKNEYYMTIHGSVQEKSGEYMSKDKQEKSLIYERYKKQREIDKQKYDLRRDNFWTGLKGAGAAGSGALTVGAGVSLFLLPIPLNIVAGLAGGAVGFTGLRSFGLSFIQAVAKNIKMRQRLRDLKNKGGAKGDRGLKEIEKAIAYNRDLKKIMDDFGKKLVTKEGKVASFDEFVAYLKKNHAKTYKMITDGEYMGNIKKFYEDTCNHYQTQTGGSMRAIMGFMERHAVKVTKNDELAIERDDLYKSRFNVDGKKVKLGAKGQPVMNPDGSYIFEKGTQSMSDWIDTYNKFKIDEKTYKDKMPREYQELKQMATRSLYNVFRNSVFEEPYNADSTIEYSNHLENDGIKEYLKNNPDGDKTQIIRNAVKFLEIEARTDRYGETINHALDGTLGVSVKEQIVKDNEFGTIANGACAKLLESEGISNPSVISKTQNIVNKIQTILNRNPVTKAMFDSVSTEIDSLTSSSVQHYLRKMVEIKRDEARLTTAEIDKSLQNAAAGTDISGILTSSDVQTIKYNITNFNLGNGNYSEISNSINQLVFIRDKATNEVKVVTGSFDKDKYEDITLSSPYKNKLFEMLDEQVKACEAKERNKLRANVLSDIQNGRLNKQEDLTKYFDEFIDKINFEQVTTKLDELRTFYNTKIVKANTPALREYLKMRMSNKIELELTNKMKDNYSLYKGDDALKKIRDDVVMIQNNPFLSEEQKKRITTIMAPLIQKVLAENTIEMNMNLLSGKDYEKEVNRLLNISIRQGGFVEFLGDKAEYDPKKELQPIANRLKLFQTILSKKNTVFNFSFGEASSVDLDSPETRLILRLLLTKQGQLDNEKDNSQIKEEDINKVFSQIQMMKTQIGQFSAAQIIDSSGNIRDNEPAKKINKLIEREFLENSNIETEGNIDTIRSEYVKLLMLRRQAVTALKGQVMQMLKGHVDNPSGYLNNEGSAINNQLIESWKDVFAEMDKKIEKYQEALNRLGFNTAGLSVTGSQYILTQLTKPTTALSYAQGKTSTFDGMEMS